MWPPNFNHVGWEGRYQKKVKTCRGDTKRKSRLVGGWRGNVSSSGKMQKTSAEIAEVHFSWWACPPSPLKNILSSTCIHPICLWALFKGHLPQEAAPSPPFRDPSFLWIPIATLLAACHFSVRKVLWDRDCTSLLIRPKKCQLEQTRSHNVYLGNQTVFKERGRFQLKLGTGFLTSRASQQV